MMNFLNAGASGKRFVILGFDGMDPAVVLRLIKRGEMPNMKRLSDRGVFTMMESSLPPQSPVAWGTFIAGADPGVTGIFDFIHRNPENYTPMFSQSETQPGKWVVKLGKYHVPLKPGKVILNREGRAFWDYLQDRDIEATIFKVPTNYPPSASGQRTLAGLGTPDILGTYGIYTLYTADVNESQQELPATNVYYAYVDENNVMEGQIDGPKNDLVVPEDPYAEPEAVIVPFKVYVDFTHRTARIDVQGHEVLLAEGEYSRWVEIDFPLIPMVQSLTGMVKFYLLQAESKDKFRLYITPVQISPAHPALPVSTPGSYSADLAKQVGLFHTLGLPADTKALSNNTFSMENYIVQSNSILAESKKLLDYELHRFLGRKQGLLFFYFSSLDQGQHMFWALNDPQHPYYHPDEAKRHGYITEEYYREADRIVGRVQKALPRDAALLVMSDHGFAPFRRQLNVNSWLAKEGYLALSAGSLAAGASIYDQADWGRSRAYALGLNGFYLNLSGREGQGIVTAAQKRPLLEEIKAKLEAITDPKSGEKVIRTAYISEDHFSKNWIQRAPDIILGFERGYRINDDSALGVLSAEVVEDNLSWWSGDHLMDPRRVPASFLSSFAINRDVPRLKDVAPTILRYFGIDTPSQMNGTSLI